jgi:hypothetical protein
MFPLAALIHARRCRLDPDAPLELEELQALLGALLGQPQLSADAARRAATIWLEEARGTPGPTGPAGSVTPAQLADYIASNRRSSVRVPSRTLMG